MPYSYSCLKKKIRINDLGSCKNIFENHDISQNNKSCREKEWLYKINDSARGAYLRKYVTEAVSKFFENKAVIDDSFSYSEEYSKYFNGRPYRMLKYNNGDCQLLQIKTHSCYEEYKSLIIGEPYCLFNEYYMQIQIYLFLYDLPSCLMTHYIMDGAQLIMYDIYKDSQFIQKIISCIEDYESGTEFQVVEHNNFLIHNFRVVQLESELGGDIEEYLNNRKSKPRKNSKKTQVPNWIFGKTFDCDKDLKFYRNVISNIPNENFNLKSRLLKNNRQNKFEKYFLEKEYQDDITFDDSEHDDYNSTSYDESSPDKEESSNENESENIINEKQDESQYSDGVQNNFMSYIIGVFQNMLGF